MKCRDCGEERLAGLHACPMAREDGDGTHPGWKAAREKLAAEFREHRRAEDLERAHRELQEAVGRERAAREKLLVQRDQELSALEARALCDRDAREDAEDRVADAEEKLRLTEEHAKTIEAERDALRLERAKTRFELPSWVRPRILLAPVALLLGLALAHAFVVAAQGPGPVVELVKRTLTQGTRITASWSSGAASPCQFCGKTAETVSIWSLDSKGTWLSWEGCPACLADKLEGREVERVRATPPDRSIWISTGHTLSTTPETGVDAQKRMLTDELGAGPRVEFSGTGGGACACDQDGNWWMWDSARARWVQAGVGVPPRLLRR